MGASLNLSAEDLASVGAGNFESLLREHVSLVLSDALDALLLNGDTATEVNETLGIFSRLDDPVAPDAAAATWSVYVSMFASGVDGLWAEGLSDVSMVFGLETYRHAVMSYRSAETDLSALAWSRAQTGGVRTNARMPAAALNIQENLIIRRGRPGMRTAVAPTWGSITVDDIYTGARKAERRYVVSALVGDLIVVQPAVYERAAVRVAV